LKYNNYRTGNKV